MCSIFGVESKSIPVETLREHFDRTVVPRAGHVPADGNSLRLCWASTGWPSWA